MTTSPPPIVVWLRDDLRLLDNPALADAAESDRPIVVLYVLDEESEGVRPLGAAHHWWLHHSLASLAKDLAGIGAKLILRRGAAGKIVPDVIAETKATGLWFNRRYDQGGDALDDGIAESLPEDVEVQRFRANLLHDPKAVQTKTGGFYRVYTPFWRNLSQSGEPRDPIDAPTKLLAPKHQPKSDDLDAWKLLPVKPDWSGGMAADWVPGEAAALERFDEFCEDLLDDYHNGRERPADDATSRMSPRLRFGEISPFTLWHRATEAARRRKGVPDKAIETFQKELVWREFNYHLLYHFGALATRNFNPRFDKFTWRKSASDLKAWQKGLTGYPIVDAAMRQLWQTGWMHNRMRMIVGSFLTKDLLIDWQEGERWFWDTLVDGDIASNTSQWQWIGGSGADAQPFFRIFNPVAQGQKFDSAGVYIRRYI
ncbi:MAG: deoxyribodipyrimidine photo-lyase, partial [Hyphomicrobiales bacterium]